MNCNEVAELGEPVNDVNWGKERVVPVPTADISALELVGTVNDCMAGSESIAPAESLNEDPLMDVSVPVLN